MTILENIANELNAQKMGINEFNFALDMIIKDIETLRKVAPKWQMCQICKLPNHIGLERKGLKEGSNIVCDPCFK